MSGWQPIETAPENEDILVTGGVLEMEIGGELDGYSIAHVRRICGGFWVENCSGYASWVNNPEKWMAAPKPPA